MHIMLIGLALVAAGSEHLSRHADAFVVALAGDDALPNTFALDDIAFEPASTAIPQSDVLDEVAKSLAENPTARVRVDGYSDAEGAGNDNIGLSASRALAVKSYLVRRGANANQIEAKGHGSANPIASNDTDAGKALNRRVELVLVSR